MQDYFKRRGEWGIVRVVSKKQVEAGSTRGQGDIRGDQVVAKVCNESRAQVGSTLPCVYPKGSIGNLYCPFVNVHTVKVMIQNGRGDFLGRAARVLFPIHVVEEIECF